MIFDATKVSALIVSYKASRDQLILEDILKESTPLVKAVVVSFGFNFSNGRDARAITVRAGITGNDLIQDCLTKITKAVWLYDGDVSSPYNYFVSIIRNACKDALGKISEEEHMVEDCEIDNVLVQSSDEYGDDTVLTELKKHNRERFPSLASDVIDDITEYVWLQTMRWDKEPRKIGRIARDITKIYTHISKPDACIVCYSTYVYMRLMYKDSAYDYIQEDDSLEYSLLPELKMLLGTNTYNRFLTIFSGMEIEIP